MRAALFGGSFNPPHVCHVQAVEWALSSGAVDRVVVVPCRRHAFDKALASFEHRREMACLAFAPLGEAVEVSDIEERLGGTSRTLDTLVALRQERPGWSWRLLIGTDILEEASRWYRFDDVARLAPPLVVGRSGFDGATGGMVLPNVSSSEIRCCVRKGRDYRDLVPESVALYIGKHRLYREES